MDTEYIIENLTNIKSNLEKLDEYELFEKDISESVFSTLDTIINRLKDYPSVSLVKKYIKGETFYIWKNYIFDDKCKLIFNYNIFDHIQDDDKTMITRALGCYIITNDDIKEIVCESEVHATKSLATFKIKSRNPFNSKIYDTQFADIPFNKSVKNYSDGKTRITLNNQLVELMIFFAYKYTQVLNSTSIV